MASPERLLAVIELQNAIAAAALSADEVMQLVADRIATLTGGTGGAVGVFEGDDIVYRAASGVKVAADSRAPRTSKLDGQVSVPLLYGEAAVGEIIAIAPSTDETTEVLRLVAQIIAIALHRSYTYPKPPVDVHTDPLTKLANKRAFDERILAELARNKRYGHSFSLAVLKLDGLETVSDRFGQAGYDETVKAVAQILKTATRAIDACFRLAADEFAIVLPGTSLEGAQILVDRCRAQINAVPHCDNTVVPSFGVVAAASETSEELLARASEKLTSDKQTRRRTRTNPPIKVV